jgi:hypothetical protein
MSQPASSPSADARFGHPYDSRAEGFRGEVARAAEALHLDLGKPEHREVLLCIVCSILFPTPPRDPFTLQPPAEYSWPEPLRIWVSGRYQRDWQS